MIKSLFIHQHQCPGDILMVTAAVRDLKKAFPDLRVNVDTTAMELWDNNPLIDRTLKESDAEKVIHLQYPLIHQSDSLPYHFIHAFRIELEKQLDVQIPQGPFKPDLYLNEKEKLPATGPFWIIDAGHKSDFPLKYWGAKNFAELVKLCPDVTFVQVGEASHHHPPLPGDNVINRVGQTSIRELIALVYRCQGVITPVSFPMHLAAAVPTMDGRLRPCIVIAGGREPSHWEAYPGHHFLHTVGMFDCCRRGGCWKGKPDDCKHPVTIGSDRIGTCMSSITPQRVSDLIHQIIRNA